MEAARTDRTNDTDTSAPRRPTHGSSAPVVLALGILGAFAHASPVHANAPAAGLELFENRVRPLLVDRCYECHSARTGKSESNLRLDSRDAILAGGRHGPALVPGQPKESLLVKAVRGTARDLKAMPAKGPSLADAEIAALEEWIRLGAPDPRTSETTSKTNAPAPPPSTAEHWAFNPPVALPVPGDTPGTPPSTHPIDRWIRQKLASRGATASPGADRRTLLRRLSMDLIGLPPTPSEMRAFIEDASPDAYERQVDRLLASPRHGERWARHWLDVARYADTKGYVFEEERRYAYAYTYRDWVVQAINRDLPYDRFLVEQIAGDRLATPHNPSSLAALGFLTLGRRFLNNPHDIIDDRLDVIFRGTQALTIQCARCHDHKSDPITMADYYGLYGVFSSSEEPAEKPLLEPNPSPLLRERFEADRTTRLRERDEFRARKTDEARRMMRERAPDYWLALNLLASAPAEVKREEFLRQRKLDPSLARNWESALARLTNQHPAILTPWFTLASPAAPPAGDAFKAAAFALASGKEPSRPPLNPLLASNLVADPPANLEALANHYVRLFQHIESTWAATLSNFTAATSPASLPNAAAEELRRFLQSDSLPSWVSTEQAFRVLPTADQQRNRALQRQVDELEATHPGAPRRAMALVDTARPANARILRRGSPANPGDEVPRQFLRRLSPSGKPFSDGSGRLELAAAIASRSNPLTARVFVNRAWHAYFGNPFVRTPADFGVRSDPPSHPELLDWLAVWFMEHDWSMKQLHRLIVTSHTYRQSTDPGPAPEARSAFEHNNAVDPQNTLLWRMNRKRADFESFRDSILAATDAIDLAVGGLPVPMFGGENSVRRTLYGFVDRQNLPGVLRSFDFASPDTSTPIRFETSVPQQALYVMNSAFAASQAAALASRTHAPSAVAQVRAMFEATLQRVPSNDELEAAVEFVSDQSRTPPPPPPRSAAWLYGSGTFNAAARRIVDFKPFTSFSNKSWKDETQTAATSGNGPSLEAGGGKPGRASGSPAIRRWIAPSAGRARIESECAHGATDGTGIRVRIVSSRLGEIAGGPLRQSSRRDSEIIQVQGGDTLDFMAESGGPDANESFRWTVRITLEPDSPPGPPSTWDSREDFSGPRTEPTPLNPWEKLAQALLASNEFVFID